MVKYYAVLLTVTKIISIKNKPFCKKIKTWKHLSKANKEYKNIRKIQPKNFVKKININLQIIRIFQYKIWTYI